MDGISQSEIKLRYDNLWKSIFIVALPTVFVMAITASYTLLDKFIALSFVTPNVLTYEPYVQWYKENITFNGGIFTYQTAKVFVNLSTQFSSQIYNLLFSFAVLLGIGTSITFSIKYGQGHRQQTQSIAGNSLTVTFLFSVAVAFVVFCLVYPAWDNVMILIQMSKRGSWITQDLTWQYVWPMLLGAPLMFISYLLLTLLRTNGKGKVAIWITLGSIGTNAFFSIILTKYGQMLLSGPMVGTIIAWLITIGICFILIFRNKHSYLRFQVKDLLFLKKKNIRDFFRLGFSSFFNSLGIVLVSLFSSTIVSHLPGQEAERQESGVSTFQLFNSAITPWTSLFIAIALGIGQGVKSIIAYSFGAKKYLRMYQATWRGFILIFGWLIFALLIYVVLGPQLLKAFAFPIDQVQKYRWWAVTMLGSLPFSAISFIAVALFQGINNGRLALLCSAFRTIIILPIMMICGYFIAHSFDDGTSANSFYYFLMLGLNDLISGLIVGLILFRYWWQHRRHIYNENSKDDRAFWKNKEQKVEIKK